MNFSYDTEFKSARGGVANTQVGTIVLGVAEKPTGLVWEGVPDAAQLCAFSELPSVQA